MGYRELCLQRVGQPMSAQSRLQAYPRRHRVLFARGLPRLQHLSCLPCAECETRRTPEQDPNLLGQTYRRRAVLRSDSRRHAALRFFAPLRPALLLVPGILIAVFLPVVCSDGAANPLSSPISYANYPSHLSPGQKPFKAPLNLPNSPLILPSLRNRCSGGKFVVPRAGEAYDWRDRGPNRKFWVRC